MGYCAEKNSLEHTEYEPSLDEWKCPNCGRVTPVFYLASEIHFCDRMHKDDEIRCTKCNLKWTGEEIAKIMAAKKSK